MNTCEKACLSLFLTLFVGCQAAPIRSDGGRLSTDVPAAGRRPAVSAESAPSTNLITGSCFGIEAVPWQRPDALRKTLPAFKELGIGLLGRNKLDWASLEPAPPAAGIHRYNWSRLDDEFRIYHDAGFQLQVVVWSRSPWATVVPDARLPMVAGSPPTAEHWEDWGKFIFELVERFDGDGQNDAFPMHAPLIRILSIQGEVELPGHWAKWDGTRENYDRLLSVAREHAHRADPAVIVARAGVSCGDFFDTAPPPGRLEALARTNAKAMDLLAFLDFSLAHPGSWDAFGLHANTGYTGIEPFTAFIRGRMAAKGYGKPILVEDASTVYAGDEGTAYDTARAAEIKELFALYRVLDAGEQNSPACQAARKTILAHQANMAVKKAVVALHAGIECILFTGYSDAEAAAFPQMRHGGLIDTVAYRKTGDVRQSLKPAYHALKLLLDRVIGAERRVRRLDAGPHAFAFEFIRNGEPFYVLWGDGGGGEITLPWAARAPVTTEIPTGADESKPRVRRESLRDGSVRVALAETPRILEGEAP